MAHAARDKLLNFSSWNAQPGGPLALTPGDERAGDIIPVTGAVDTHENCLEQYRYLNMEDLRPKRKEVLRRAA